MAKKLIKETLLEKVKRILMQRRVWAAGISGIAAVLAALGYWQAVSVLSILAGTLGMHSYVKPKQ